MNRFLMTAALAVTVAAAAIADLGPRPKGPVGKSIPVQNVLKFANEFPNHTFWAVTQGFNGPKVITLKPDTAKPLPLTMNLTTSAIVYAVPNDAAKTFATPKEFVQAAAAGKLPAGVIVSPTFVKAEQVQNNDRRTAIDRIVVVAGGIKAGVTFAEEDPVKRDPEPEPPADARPAPRLFAVGLAAALAVMFGGLWLVRRGK